MHVARTSTSLDGSILRFHENQNSRCTNSLCGCSARICFLGIILSVALPGLALAGDPPPVDDSASRWGEHDQQDADGIRPVDSSPADQGLSVTQSHLTREGEGEDQSVRVRIETGQGVFVVYDAAIPAKPIVRGDRVGAPRKRGGYLAY